MKKIHDLMRPSILIVLGGLILLSYLNDLQLTNAWLAVGIVATVTAVYYIAVGIIVVLLGAKLTNKVKDILGIISLCLFPAFTFTEVMVTVCLGAGAIGPTGWIIGELALIASLAVIGITIARKVKNAPVLARINYLVGMVFALVLLLRVIFNAAGDPVVLGGLPITKILIGAAYCYYFFVRIANETNQEEVGKEFKAPKEEKEEVEE